MNTAPRKTSPSVIIAAALVAAVVAGTFWIAQLEKRIRVLEDQLHFREPLSMFTGRERIVSADRAVDGQHLDLRLTPGGNVTNRFQLRGHYKIPEAARPVAAWVSQWTPRADMMKFDEFYLVPNADTGEVELVAKPRSGETIDMTFDVHIFVRDYPGLIRR